MVCCAVTLCAHYISASEFNLATYYVFSRILQDNKFGNKALRDMLGEVWTMNARSLSELENRHASGALEIIDKHLREVLDATPPGADWRRSLAPYDDDGETLHSYYSMMQSFLTSSRLIRFTEKRVEAIKNGKGLHQLMQSLEDGDCTQEECLTQLNEQVEESKSMGLNFNAVARLFLYDVGVTLESSSATKSRPPINVAKFLNRCLGMPLSRQAMLTNHFLKWLEKEIKEAKRSGRYDVSFRHRGSYSIV